MADTKISALTAASALTGTEEIPLSDGTTTTKACTAAQIKTYTNTSPTWTGSATAGSWPILSQAKMQLEAQKAQQEAAAEAQRLQLETQKTAAELQLVREKAAAQLQLEREKALMSAESDMRKHEMSTQASLATKAAEMDSESEKESESSAQNDRMYRVLETMAQALAARGGHRVVRGPDGRIAGTEPT